jgi:hypothetical protein
MNCQEAESFISVLYDGEKVPAECADHIDTCPTCREKLRSYSQMGAELRLLASRMPAVSEFPQAVLERTRFAERPDRFAFLRARMVVPKFAAIAAAAAVVALSASVVVVRAQNQSAPLWFQFTVSDGQPPTVVQAGFDDMMASVTPVLDANRHPVVNQQREVEMQTIASHIAVYSIKDGKVHLAIRSRRYRDGDPAAYKGKEQLVLEHHTFTYTPGQTLEVPVEGGGTLALRGLIADHQPKFAWGNPVEPRPDQLVVTHPVLFQDKTVLAFMDGASASADTQDWAATLFTQVGRFTIALRPFPGAVEAQAEWGKLQFKVNGESYTLYSASPICGGEQPHTVWVELDAKVAPPKGDWAITTLPIPKPAQ